MLGGFEHLYFMSRKRKINWKSDSPMLGLQLAGYFFGQALKAGRILFIPGPATIAVGPAKAQVFTNRPVNLVGVVAGPVNIRADLVEL